MRATIFLVALFGIGCTYDIDRSLGAAQLTIDGTSSAASAYMIPQGGDGFFGYVVYFSTQPPGTKCSALMPPTGIFLDGVVPFIYQPGATHATPIAAGTYPVIARPTGPLPTTVWAELSYSRKAPNDPNGEIFYNVSSGTVAVTKSQTDLLVGSVSAEAVIDSAGTVSHIEGTFSAPDCTVVHYHSD